MHPVDEHNRAEYVRDLEARLAEAKGLLEEIGDEWPAVKRTTVERAYALIARPADSASLTQEPKT